MDPNARQLPANERFGWFLAGLFAAAAFVGVFRLPPVWPLLFAGAALVTVCITLLAPPLLAGPNRLWQGLGLQLGRLFGPLVLMAVFFLLLTPLALLGRLCGRDELRLRKKPGTGSYWITRTAQHNTPDSFKNQY